MPSVNKTLGARFKIEGEEEYKRVLQNLNAGSKTLASEMVRLQAQYKGNTESVEFLTSKSELLGRTLDQQREKTAAVRSMVEAAAKAQAEALKAVAEAENDTVEAQNAAKAALEAANREYQKYATQLNTAETEEIKLTHAIQENADALKAAESGLSTYQDAIGQINQNAEVLASELELLKAQYQDNADSAEYMGKAGEILNAQLQEQHAKVETLQETLQKVKEAYGENSDEAKKLTVELNRAMTDEVNLQHAITENTEALEGQGEEMLGLGDTVESLADKLGINLPQGAKDALNGMQGLSAGTVAAMAAAAAAIAAIVKVVMELGKLTLDVAAQVDEYITESTITGVPTEMLQAWDYAAPLIDTDAETIKGAMTKITQAMGDAAGGSTEAQAKFSALGVSIVDETTGNLRSAEEVFYDVVDALGQMGAGTERNAAAMELMGKSAQELNPLINAGSDALKKYGEEARATGYILDEEQIRKLGEVDDAYQKLQLTIEANRKQMAADFAPAAKEAMELFSDAVAKAGQMLERSGLIENLASIIESLIDILRTGGEILAGIPGFNQGLSILKVTLGAVAQFVALIADAADVVGGLFQVITGSGGGRMAGLERIGNAMGFGMSSGTLSNYKTVYMQQSGTYDQYQEFHANLRGESTREGLGYDSATGQYYDIRTGNYVYGYNAGGTENWRGGLTWVGEAGPELVSLPQGSQVLSAQESAGAGDVYIETVVIDANDINELNDIVRIFHDAKVKARMR